ncbi:MAG: hypothetical protein J1F64_10955, partial [Oscillospiraceae bacterium]|nr:hypothetical protein [Oscillospiraceae bacterium]
MKKLFAIICALAAFSTNAYAAWEYTEIKGQRNFVGAADDYFVMAYEHCFYIYDMDGNLTDKLDENHYNSSKYYIRTSNSTGQAESAIPYQSDNPNEAVGFIKNEDGKYAAVNFKGEVISDYIYSYVMHKFRANETSRHLEEFAFETPHGNPSRHYVPVRGSQTYATVVIDGRAVYIAPDLHEIDPDTEVFYTNINDLDERYALIYTGNDDPSYSLNTLHAIYDKETGEITYRFLERVFSTSYNKSNGYIIFRTDAGTGVMDLYGNVIIEPKYISLSWTGNDGNYLSYKLEYTDPSSYQNQGIIDIDENIIISQSYNSISKVGIYFKVSDTWNSGYRLIDVNREDMLDFKLDDIKFIDDDTYIIKRPDDDSWTILNLAEIYASVKINGEPLICEQSAVVRDNRTLVPMRAIIEALGGTA